MMAEFLCVPSRDDSYWSVELNFTDLSPSDLAPEGLLQFDLSITQTCMVLSIDEDGNPRQSTETDLRQITMPTIDFPGTINREQCYSDLLQWLQSKDLDLPNLQGSNFTEYVIERVFQRGKGGEKLAMRVSAVLQHVSKDYKPYVDLPLELDESDEEETEDDDDDDYDYDYDYEEEDKGLSEYCIQKLRGLHVFPAAEEHRKLGGCSICLAGLVSDGDEEKGDLFKSPRGHVFHGNCMSAWLRRRNSCPLCRVMVVEIIKKIIW